MTSPSPAGEAPAGDHLGIDTTTIDGRSYALAYCLTCGGRIGAPFRRADLDAITAAGRAHKCQARVPGAATS
jgi:hypothetical protein